MGEEYENLGLLEGWRAWEDQCTSPLEREGL